MPQKGDLSSQLTLVARSSNVIARKYLEHRLKVLTIIYLILQLFHKVIGEKYSNSYREIFWIKTLLNKRSPVQIQLSHY